ncbi:hypothetical protein Halha_2498 [Halobacteroides halobius DSM 5150]|uniref:DUF4363 domain-containing protein n=1 Tax=Halobacteroides halobius (strain ATCC 35273 / DSM 5150 / MD-1) TaxID=748449 RepID=L0KAR2_HALHC|nr:DUF4363 family protein [Halobacteroides halobius]AGB42372.1 hypothetical protein Halha_2498 [Halobacteroides halobius DSM 5150]
MKKVLIGNTLFLILMVGLTFYGYKEVVHSANPLLNKLNTLEKNIENNNWQQASLTSKALQKNWERTQNLWTLVLHHNRVDDLENSLTRIKKAVAIEEEAEALIEIAVSKRLIRNVPNTEEIDIKNIF